MGYAAGEGMGRGKKVLDRSYTKKGEVWVHSGGTWEQCSAPALAI